MQTAGDLETSSFPPCSLERILGRWQPVRRLRRARRLSLAVEVQRAVRAALQLLEAVIGEPVDRVCHLQAFGGAFPRRPLPCSTLTSHTQTCAMLSAPP